MKPRVYPGDSPSEAINSHLYSSNFFEGHISFHKNHGRSFLNFFPVALTYSNFGYNNISVLCSSRHLEFIKVQSIKHAFI